MTDTPPPAAALAAKCKAWREAARIEPMPGPDVPRVEFFEWVNATRDKAMGHFKYLPLAARALEVLVEAMGRAIGDLEYSHHDRCATGLSSGGGCTCGMQTRVDEARNALRAAAAIVEEVSDGDA